MTVLVEPNRDAGACPAEACPRDYCGADTCKCPPCICLDCTARRSHARARAQARHEGDAELASPAVLTLFDLDT